MASNLISEKVIVKEISLKDISAKSLHAMNTLLLELEGPSVHLINYDILQHVLQVKVGIDREDINLLYNLGNHSQWYLNLTKEAESKCHEVLHNQMFTVRDYNFTVTLKHLDVTRTKAYLEWVPPAFTPTNVKSIVQSIANPQTEIGIKDLKNCIWEINFDPEDKNRIPHYINVNLFGNTYQTLQLRIPGRETPCFFCSSDQHESSMCLKNDGTSKRFAFLSNKSCSINLERRNTASSDAWFGQWLAMLVSYLPFCHIFINPTELDEELPTEKRNSPENKKPERRLEFMWEKDIDDASDGNLETVSYGDPAMIGDLNRPKTSRNKRNRRTSEASAKSETPSSVAETPGSDAGTPVSLAGRFGYVSAKYKTVSEVSGSAAGASGKNKNKRATRPKTLAIAVFPKCTSSMKVEKSKRLSESNAESIASELCETEKLVRPGSFTTSYVQSANTDVAKWVTPTVGTSPSFEPIYLTSNYSPITPISPSLSLNSPTLFPDIERSGSFRSTASSDQGKSVIGKIREYFSGVNKKK